MKKTLTFYEYTTVCHKYVVEVDVPEGTDITKWLLDEDEKDGLADLYGKVVPKQIACEVDGIEVWDSESGQLLLEY